MTTARAVVKEKSANSKNEFKGKPVLLDKKEQHELVVDNKKRAILIAMRYVGIGRKFGLMFEDLEQSANEGFTIAAKRFDRSRGVKFTTYAGIWAVKCIMDQVDNSNPLHLPRNAKHKVKTMKEALEAIRNDLNPSELSKDARKEYNSMMNGGKSPETMERKISMLEIEIINAVSTNISLDQPMTEDGDPPHEFIVSTEETASEEVERKDLRKIILDAMETLSNRERIIVEERFLTVDPCSFKELGGMMGISRARVHKNYQDALRKLRKALKRYIKEEEGGGESSDSTLSGETLQTVKDGKIAYLVKEDIPYDVVGRLDLENISLDKLIRFIPVAKRLNVVHSLKSEHFKYSCSPKGFEAYVKRTA